MAINLISKLQRDELIESVSTYFDKTNSDKVRIETWNEIVNTLQMYAIKPDKLSIRIFMTRDGNPSFVFKTDKDKLMIPVIDNRIIKLKKSDFDKVGMTVNILEVLTLFKGTIFKVYNNNSRPVVVEEAYDKYLNKEELLNAYRKH